jgi:ceramide glucosyltransferase
MLVAALLIAAWLTGGVVFCALVVVASRRYLAVPRRTLMRPTPISVLKPLAGGDEGLEDNLRSFFAQEYPEFEILCAVRNPGDAAAPVVEKLRREFPGVPSRLLFTGEPPWANAKDYSLELMLGEACHDLIVMSDSDTWVAPGLLAEIAAEFEDQRVDMASCPYRAVGGRDLWSRLEAVGMNTELLAGVLVARMLEGMQFGLGPVMAARRSAIEAIGGFEAVKDYPADDFVLGRLVAEAGMGNVLSNSVIEHRLGTQTWRGNLEHRLRWIRAARRMRSAGYLGQVFTFPLVPALLLPAVAPVWWPLAAIGVAARALAAWATGGWVLHDRALRSAWWMIPIQDLAGFALWIAGFFGNTVSWRGRRYVVFADGKFAPAPTEPAASVR